MDCSLFKYKSQDSCAYYKIKISNFHCLDCIFPVFNNSCGAFCWQNSQIKPTVHAYARTLLLTCFYLLVGCPLFFSLSKYRLNTCHLQSALMVRECVAIQARRTWQYAQLVYNEIFHLEYLRSQWKTLQFRMPEMDHSFLFETSTNVDNMKNFWQINSIMMAWLDLVWFDLIWLHLEFTFRAFVILFELFIHSQQITNTQILAFRCNKQTENIWFNSTYVDFLSCYYDSCNDKSASEITQG